MPIHGEYQNLIRHAELAESVGIPAENITVAEDGELIHLTSETCEVFAQEKRSGRVLVDGKPEVGLEDIVLRDRIQLSEGGIVVPIILLNGDADDSDPQDDFAVEETSETAPEPTDSEQPAASDSDAKTALSAEKIEIISRGFVYMDESEELMEEAKEITRGVIENMSEAQKDETEIVQDEIRRALRRFFSKQMQRTPLIFPVVMRG